MAAHEILAEGQFHRREGRPNKHEHGTDDEESNAPRKPHVREHKSRPPAKHRGKG